MNLAREAGVRLVRRASESWADAPWPDHRAPDLIDLEAEHPRVESVRFLKPGRYLVICAVHPHFVDDGMFGFVKVTEQDRDD
jgi:hypothetical protein